MNSPILPSQVFFNPNQEFLTWAKKNLRGNILVDCGAGIGRLTNQLLKNGLNALAIDINEREESETLIIREDSTSFSFPYNSIAIIARPNRGDWIQDTINHALKVCKYVLYIGIEKNIGEDIESLNNLHVEKVFDNAGDDKEFVYKISKDEIKEKDMITYHLVQMTHGNDSKIVMSGWYEDDGNRWKNFNGGWCDKSPTDKILETQDAEDIHDLDWTKTNLVDKNSKSGWLDREGKFTGCQSRNHDIVADLVFNKTVTELEKAGWVRIYYIDEWACDMRMSVEQRNFMSTNGYLLRDHD